MPELEPWGGGACPREARGPFGGAVGKKTQGLSSLPLPPGDPIPQAISNSCLNRPIWEICTEGAVGIPAHSLGRSLNRLQPLPPPVSPHPSSLQPPSARGTSSLLTPTSSPKPLPVLPTPVLPHSLEVAWHLLQEAFPDYTLPHLDCLSPLLLEHSVQIGDKYRLWSHPTDGDNAIRRVNRCKCQCPGSRL